LKDTRNVGDITLGKKIRQLRLDRKITQQELVGDFITRNMLSQIENDVAMPSMKTLQYLADVLEIPLSYLVDNESDFESYTEHKHDSMQFHDARDKVLIEIEKMHQSFMNNQFDECMECCKRLANIEIEGTFMNEYIQRQISLYKLRCLSIRELNMDSKDFLKNTVDMSDLCRYNIMLSEKFTQENDIQNALDCLKQAEDLIEPFLNHPYRIEIYKALESCYVNLEDYKNAHLYSTKLLTLLQK
jgi:transcriptional regulator with XRE-family HTH domain